MSSKFCTIVAVFSLACAAFAVGEFDRALLHGETNRERATEYAPGETIAFTLSLQRVEKLPAEPHFIKWTLHVDGGERRDGREPVSLEKPLVLTTKLDRPGFVRLTANLVDEKGKVVRRASSAKAREARVFFEGGEAVQPEKLQGVPEPADFDAFWSKQKAELAAVPFKGLVKLEKKPSKGGVEVYAVEIPCAGPRPVTGHITIPVGAKQGKTYPARLTVDGYNGNLRSWEQAPTGGPGGEIRLHINAHGYDLGKDREYYAEFAKRISSHGQTYALAAEEHPEAKGCYFEGMTWRVMRALDYLKSRPEWNGRDLIVSGGSQGGLQTVWAAGLDPQVTRALPGVPWCCDMGGNATLGRVKKNWGVAWTPAMGYYDPVNLAKRVAKTCHVEITRAGLGDYTCPPSGVAILYNNLPCPKKINWVQGSTHGYVPPEPHQAYSCTGNGWREGRSAFSASSRAFDGNR